MSRLNSTIDKINCSITEKAFKLIAGGWCAVDKKDDYTLRARTPDGEELKGICSRSPRPDVVSTLGAQEEKGLGFSFGLKEAPEIAEKGVILYAEKEGETFELCSYSPEELKIFAKDDPVYYAVDSKDLEDGVITLVGWAICLSAEDLEYSVNDSAGKPVEFELERNGRWDINDLYMEGSFDYLAGFKLKIKCTGSKKYTVSIAGKGGSVSFPVSEKAIADEIKARNQAYKDAKSIIKGLTPRVIAKDIKVLFSEGPESYKMLWRERVVNDKFSYDLRYRKNRPDAAQLEEQRKTKFEKNPRISLIVPVYQNVSAKHLKQMVSAVQAQTYRGWELCIADGTAGHIAEKALKPFTQKDSRIRYIQLEENSGYAACVNAAFDAAKGAFFALTGAGDILAEDALYEVVKALNENPDSDVVYTDEDKITKNLKHYYEPDFKSDFNRNLLRSNNYIGHLFVVSKRLVKKTGGFDASFAGAESYDFILRCTEKAKVLHVRRMLYHLRKNPGADIEDTESVKTASEAGKRAVQAQIDRLGLSGTVEDVQGAPGFFGVRYKMQGNPKISIIIPNKDETETLKTCVDSILEKTAYDNYEIVIIENNSVTEEIFEYYKELEKNPKIKVIRWESDFNYSAINNFGIRHSDGEYIVLLNNDTEVLTSDWLEVMAADLQRENIGCVGVKLLYPDSTIQHCGVVTGLGGVAGHAFAGKPADCKEGFGRAIVSQDVNAVTAACLMVSRKVFDEVGGLEEGLKVNFNDVDFCWKIRKAGYTILYESLVYLTHYESKSRGHDDSGAKRERFLSEVYYIQEKWADLLAAEDQYYPVEFLKVIGSII